MNNMSDYHLWSNTFCEEIKDNTLVVVQLNDIFLKAYYYIVSVMLDVV